MSARKKSVGVVEKTDASKLQELNNRINNLTATLKANNLRQKSASAPSSPAKKWNDNSNPPPAGQKAQRSLATGHSGGKETS